MSWDPDQLRAALAGGNAGIATLLADHPNPTVRLLSEIWASQARTESAVEDDEPPAADPPADRAASRRIARLEEELQRTGEFIDALAAALGACARCWGNDPTCPACAGTGAPGSIVPDRALFARFIAPAVHRLAEARRERLEASTSTQPTPVKDRTMVTERSQS